jgi:hypothetical protein
LRDAGPDCLHVFTAWFGMRWCGVRVIQHFIVYARLEGVLL